MKPERVKKILHGFESKKICVIGDAMLDRYVFGDITRISPEAPVPVVLASKEAVTVGGAGNVAANVSALGGAVSLVSVTGKDRGSQDLLAHFARLRVDPSGVLRLANRPTTEKMRIVARGQQIVRVDRELQDYIDTKIEIKLLNFLRRRFHEFDGFVISDYAKGVITEMLAHEIIALAKRYKKIVIGDPKPQHAKWLKGATLVAPNEMEALAIGGASNVLEAGKKIQNLLKCDVLVTRGARGMTLFSGSRNTHFPTRTKDVYDVIGAGDTVMAALSLALTSGATLKEAVVIANHSAGVVVGKTGTATLSIAELKENLSNKAEV